jgi:hypothetical protein
MNTLELYQESVPFSNKRINNPISSGSFTNPVIVPFSFDFTSQENTLESVIYLRNNSVEQRYENIVISLMKDDQSLLVGDPVLANGTVSNTDGDISFTLNEKSVSVGYSVEDIPLSPGQSFQVTASEAELNGYYEHYIPVGDDSDISVKFSYGYDEVTSVDWEKKGNVLVIPNVGTTGVPDTSYHAIRMRITWKANTQLFTIRDYFLDASYQTQAVVEGI